MSTVQNILTSAQLKFGIDPSNIRFQSDFYDAINDSQDDIANRRRWGFLRTTSDLSATQTSRTVALPDSFGKPYDARGAIRITSPAANLGDTVQLMTLDEWTNDFYEDGSTEGTPQYAYILGSSLYLSPIPDAAYTIALIFYKRPTSIADTSTAITVSSSYTELLRMMLYKRLQLAGWSSIQEIQIADSEVERLINSAARDDISKFGGFSMNLPSSTYKRRTV